MNLNYSSQNHTTLIRNKGKVEYITFPLLELPGIVHGISTRMGGVSKGYLGSMNLSFTRGDEVEDVMMNHHLLADAIGYEERNTVLSDQVHRTVVRRVTREDAGKGLVRLSDIEETDGLVTDEPGIPLMIFTADCVPLLLADPVKRVVAASHAGWKGTVGGIAAVTVKMMVEDYDCHPDDIRVAIGPSICPECYEVSEDVAQRFQEVFAQKNWDEIMQERSSNTIPEEQRKEGKYQLNLWRANAILLEEQGIRKENIATTDLCTCCNPDYLFSHRASKGRRGNLASVIQLEP